MSAENGSDSCGTRDPSLVLLEEKRSRRRAKNKAKKEDARRAREEEIRRKLYEPKNQRVRVVDRREVDSWQGGSVRAHSPVTTLHVSVTPDEFPDLRSAKQKPRTDKNTRSQAPAVEMCQLGEESAPNNQEGTTLDSGVQSHPPSNRNVQLQCQTEKDPVIEEHVANQTSAKNSSLKPKRADPIKINLLSVIKKTPNMAERKVPPVVPKKKAMPQISGNQLDSSKPERKRGKTRENPKPQKPSHLKAVILQDRQARKAHQTELQESKESVESVAVRGSSTEVPFQVLTNNQHVSEASDCSSAVFEAEATTSLGLNESVVVRDQIALTPCIDNVVDGKENAVCNEVVCPQEIIHNMRALQVDENKVVSTIHSRKFRDYCDHMPSRELDAAVTALISDIVRFQDRLYFSDPVKAHAKRRFVLGFRETKKYLLLRKLKLVIIAPDLEMARSKGGIDDTVAELKDLSRSQGVLCVFSVGRSTLRRLTNKSCVIKGISCVGIMNYEGSQDNYHTIETLVPELRSRYQCLMKGSDAPITPAAAFKKSRSDETTEMAEEVMDVNKQVVATFLVKLSKELETK